MRMLTIALLLILATAAAASSSYRCPPTPPDADGPFYRPGAPVRDSIGDGYLLFGEVRSAETCAPVAGARIEIWMTGPDGHYDDRWRATLFSRPDGRYFFRSHIPAPYGSRPPHIHLLVNAPGFAELITQHYPAPGQGEALFDLVLIPAPKAPSPSPGTRDRPGKHLFAPFDQQADCLQICVPSDA